VDSYTVTRHKHGIVVEGPLPVGDMSALCDVWQESGFTIIDAKISGHLKATLVVTSEEGSKAWREELGI
jgi:hypothetical protein